MLNDPFVQAMCERASSTISAATADDSERIEQWFLTLFARPPEPAELSQCQQFLESLDAGPGDDGSAWQQLAHALVNRKEFVFLR